MKTEVALKMFACDGAADSIHSDPLSVYLHAPQQHFQTYQQPPISVTIQLNFVFFVDGAESCSREEFDKIIMWACPIYTL